jgi:paraquat-inducible protein B
MPAIAAGVETVLQAAQLVLGRAGETLKIIENEVSQASPLRYQLGETLKEISSASRALRVLADYLERHPDALLRGKSTGGGP